MLLCVLLEYFELLDFESVSLIVISVNLEVSMVLVNDFEIADLVTNGFFFVEVIYSKEVSPSYVVVGVTVASNMVLVVVLATLLIIASAVESSVSV